MQPMADQDIGHDCDGSRHSARGANLICLPVSHVYIFILGGVKVDFNFENCRPTCRFVDR